MTTLIDDIETSRDGGTYLIRFARPAKKNALTLAMYERMNAALAEAAADKTVKAVVFSSTRRSCVECFSKRAAWAGPAPCMRTMRQASVFSSTT